jgi:hypothetical protein
MNASRMAALCLATVIAACAGESMPHSRPNPDLGGSSGNGGALAALDGGSGGNPTAAPSAAEASTPAPDMPAAATCPFGNLLAAFPAMPVLCRPFAAPPVSTSPADPPGCKDVPQVILGDGPDTFVGAPGTRDHVLGMGGDDVLKGSDCNDEINGNQGNDWVNGNMGNDIVQGGQGSDILHGGADNDQITGGGGDDQLYGDLGDDDYLFAEGSGNDTIEETGGHDRIVCAPIYGAPAARLLGWQRSGDDLLLSLSGTGAIRVKGYFVRPDASIDAIVGC